VLAHELLMSKVYILTLSTTMNSLKKVEAF
jgi:hypothetical protein